MRPRLPVLLGAAVVLVAWTAAALPGPSRADAAARTTSITIDGDGDGRMFDGVGAVLGGGGNARYLMDYPEPQRSQILDDLFTPGAGASLQLLKLEIGGDANSTDGSEPSIEHTRGHIDCAAGYELSIAAQAVSRNRFLRLYGLQWSAPGWVADGRGSLFTNDDITYLLDWLGCARQRGLTISYLGGWNESDGGGHAAWFHRLRVALDTHGYSAVRIVAADSNPAWHYATSRDVSVLGAHDICGFPTGNAGARTACTAPADAVDSGKPLWGSELGAMDARAQTGCKVPCAPAMDRAAVRGYLDAGLTGYLEWPALDAMPAGLPFENRGLVTADQPWSGSYTVNAMTWAVAQFTQVVWPPTAANPGGWRYLDPASGFLGGERTNGSYVTLVRSGQTAYSTIIETTADTGGPQRVAVTVGGNLAGHTVHVWSSDFDFATGGPAGWFVRQPDIHPVDGRFSLTVQPGHVYSLTTTGGQGRRTVPAPPAAALALPYHDQLSSSGNAGATDDEPELLAAQDGAFELAPCAVPDGTATVCTEQKAVATPVFWHGASTLEHYPYATLGEAGWRDYTISCDTLLTSPGTSAGLIGRFDDRAHKSVDAGAFDGYVFDVATSGRWELYRNDAIPGHRVTLASGMLLGPVGTGRWHRLALSMRGSTITGSVDGRPVVAVDDPTFDHGQAGVEAGAFTSEWPRAQYSNLEITPQR